MTALTLLAAVAAAPALSCKLAAVPRYVAPAHLDCVPCEHTGGESDINIDLFSKLRSYKQTCKLFAAESWSWGLKLVWFLVKIVTHLEYECCEVQAGPAAKLLTR